MSPRAAHPVALAGWPHGDRTAGSRALQMIKFFLAVLVLGVVALAGGFIYLGAKPPRPQVQQMHVLLPNDRFGGS
ncbi:hypothetical protein [Lichenicoccus roseus]|uniref:Uncharacterized protein n=1 Tax=Lichenicoccus roseus TaxID=2683649 RepID=A0A5R9JDK4_9PROT|nr:hypothetical protein [Lichenicoccus roseus]TLU72378.1 hypothetical protein FE263_09865 [Lichenicoccus roseus]